MNMYNSNKKSISESSIYHNYNSYACNKHFYLIQMEYFIEYIFIVTTELRMLNLTLSARQITLKKPVKFSSLYFFSARLKMTKREADSEFIYYSSNSGISLILL